MRWNSTTCFPVDVQFEDIDGGGVVHHPNYLKYLERARCQAMREIGVPFEACLKEGIAFVVAELNAKYLKPVLLGQKVFVLTQLVALRKSSLKVFQKIVESPPPENLQLDLKNFFSTDRGHCFVAQLRLVAVDLRTGRPVPVPDALRVAGGCPSFEEMQTSSTFSEVRLTPFAD
ncbi:MAG: tol-pal system-associated acyl-CoA thioesterase [Pseudomonadota bacterium]